MQVGTREPAAALLGRPNDERADAALLGHITRDRIFFQEFWFPDLSERRADQKSIHEYRYDPQNHVKLIWSQYPLILDPVLNASCGRGVMKTIGAVQRRALQDAIVYAMVKPCIFMMTERAIIPNHWEPLTMLLKPDTGHPVFSALVSRISAETRQIWFRNGSVISCISQGQQVGGQDSAPTGVQGHRSSSMYLDESQQSSQKFMREAAQTQAGLDAFNLQDQRNRGAALRYTGVLGQNIDSAFAMNERDPHSPFRRQIKGANGRDVFRNWIWKLPSVACPWMTQDKHLDLYARYGCDPDNGIFTMDYWQNVWGVVPYGQNRMYPDELRLPCSITNPSWRHPKIGPQAWEAHSQFNSSVKSPATWISTSWDWLRPQLPPVKPNVQYGIGIDPGEDVTSMCIWSLDEQSKRWQWEANVTLQAWGGKSNFQQCTVVHFLAGHYQPQFIGVDATGWGSEFCASLRNDPRLIGRCEPLLHEYKYGGTVVVRYEVNASMLAHTTNASHWRRLKEEEQAVTANLQQFSMNEIRRMMEMRRYILPDPRQAEDVHRELGAMQQQIHEDSQGRKQIRYLPKHPHFVSGVQMFTVARHEWELQGARDLEKKPVDMGDWSASTGMYLGNGMF